MIICFVVDTSASMNQGSATGMSLLDCAKGAVEHFLKLRVRDPANRNDRLFLVTTEGTAAAVKVGWRDTRVKFQEELKLLKARDLSNIGDALGRAFELLNASRLPLGIDTYGQGRHGACIEPACVVLLTDAGKLCTNNGIQDDLSLPMESSPGSELTKEPFRWDQRLFTIALKLPGIQSPRLDPDKSKSTKSLQLLSEITGGQFCTVHNMKSVFQVVEMINAKLMIGVVMTFEIAGEKQQYHRFLSLRGTNARLPIPEGFWVDPSSSSLPARTAQPIVTIDRNHKTDHPFPIDLNLFDHYEFKDRAMFSPLFRTHPDGCWKVYVQNSRGDNTLGEPFGFISRRGGAPNTLHLYVLPYNYPRFFTLIRDMKGSSSDPKWKKQVEEYLRNVPPYYIHPVRSAMKRAGLGAGFPDHVEIGVLNFSVAKYLSKVKAAAKAEYDKLCSPAKGGEHKSDESNPLSAHKLHRNAFDMPRERLLEQLTRWKSHFERAADPTRRSDTEGLVDIDSRHSVPIGQMGNYQETLMKKEVLRDPFADDDSRVRRRSLFGNPFQRSQKGQMKIDVPVDEADEAPPAAGTPPLKPGNASSGRGERSAKPPSPSLGGKAGEVSSMELDDGKNSKRKQVIPLKGVKLAKRQRLSTANADRKLNILKLLKEAEDEGSYAKIKPILNKITGCQAYVNHAIDQIQKQCQKCKKSQTMMKIFLDKKNLSKCGPSKP